MERRVSRARIQGSGKFISGTAATGRLVLARSDGSLARCRVVIVEDATLTDNDDSTFNLTFSGS